MAFSGSAENPHTFTYPELERVINTNLELIVDFNQTILEGKATLIIERMTPSVNKISLDILGLDILSVTNVLDGTHLQYHVLYNSAPVSYLLYVKFPQTVSATYKSRCEIQIEYRTSPHSPALYWLTDKQTADGKHPFLLSQNKLMYARAWFPCQDTPSVKFTYTAKISVPKNFTVLMSAILRNITCNDPQLDVFEFHQINRVPSYAVIIAVGSLEKRSFTAKSNIFAERKFIDKSQKTFCSAKYTIKRMIEIAESYCGPYIWDRYDICVLPPSIAHFVIECPCVTFISPALLGGDRSRISYLARNISQSWAGNLVTCSNYEHLWLNKSISIFISKKIICGVNARLKDMNVFLQREGLNKLNSMIQNPRNVGLLKCLLPNLTEMLPHEAIEYVPYEWGCKLLDDLENILGGYSVFDPFLKSYFQEFAFKSINTNEWISYLYQYFYKEKEMLDKVAWYPLFRDIPWLSAVPKMTAWERKYFKLAKELAKWDGEEHSIPDALSGQKFSSRIERLIFLKYLHDFHKNLTKKKLKTILERYKFTRQSAEIQFVWFLLCIKVRWANKVNSALNFAIEFCSPNYACPIFQHLYEWTEMRQKAINTYEKNKDKMLHETQEKLNIILQPNL